MFWLRSACECHTHNFEHDFSTTYVRIAKIYLETTLRLENAKKSTIGPLKKQSVWSMSQIR